MSVRNYKTMKETICRLEDLVRKGLAYVLTSAEQVLVKKPLPNKWSKKEILGHLIDSGIHNLQRFTEIHRAVKPYKIRKYEQDDLVIANHYQHADIEEISDFWVAVNKRIAYIMNQQTEETLQYTIELDHREIRDLRFLMVDYVEHLEHHLNQIVQTV